MNGLLGPMVGAVGGEFTGHRVPDGKAKGKRKRPAPPNTKDHRRFSLSSVPEEHRDVALLSAFRSVGIGIKG